MDEKMKAHDERLDDQCSRLESVEEKLGAILVKLAVPLFLTSIVGVVIGAVIVALITNALNR